MSSSRRGKDKVDPLKEMADRIRGKNGVEWRTAVLADQRVEYFRGKDFASYFKRNEGHMYQWVSKGQKPEEQIRTLGELMLRRRLVVKADRLFKKPKPGKKRPTKWPKKLVPLYADQTFSEDAFYAWQYDRPSSPWLWLLAPLLAISVLLCCLFPLAPHPLKLAVVYASMAMIIAIFGLLAVRGALAGATWLPLGRSLWLFPNLLAEDKGLVEAFQPVLEWDEPSEGAGGWKDWGLRIAFAGGFALLIYALYSHGPDTGSVKGGAKHAHDAILDMLNLHGKGRQQLGYQEAAGGSPTTPEQAMSKPDLHTQFQRRREQQQRGEVDPVTVPPLDLDLEEDEGEAEQPPPSREPADQEAAASDSGAEL